MTSNLSFPEHTPEREQAEIARVRHAMTRSATVFVFGSNRAGVHGGGAARTALDRYGAVWGIGEGLHGRSYAIPTKDEQIESLTIDDVAGHVARFIGVALAHPELTFIVTRIGCGLAGFTDEQIAPLFADAPPNCELPTGWRSSSPPLAASPDQAIEGIA